MNITFRSLFLTLVTFGALSSGPARPALGLEVDRVDGNTVIFKAEAGAAQPVYTPLKTKLFDLKHLGVLHSEEGGKPFVLLMGRAGQNTAADERQLYLIRADGQKFSQFIYPGKILEPKSRQVLYDSRGFYGKCLTGSNKEVYVAFQNERIDRRRHLQPSVFVAEIGKDFVVDKLIERRMPKLQATLKRVKAKACWEIEGRNRLMLRKMMNLDPRKEVVDEDDEEKDSDDTPKENQTEQDLPSAPTEE